MKRLFSIALVAALTMAAGAEAKHKSIEDLDLTVEQREEAERIFAKEHEKMEDLMRQEREIKDKIRQLHEENMAEFEKILTPEQKAKLNETQKAHKMKHEKHKIRGMHDVKPDVQRKGPKIEKHQKDMPKGGFVEE